MDNSPLESIVKACGNVVLYDENTKIPSIFCRFTRINSADLDESLPDHPHPAFRTNGVTHDSLLLGKYKGIEVADGGTIHSLPNMPPKTCIDYDAALARMRAFGNNASGLTIADHGLLVLLAHKYGYNPHGNNAHGSDYRDAVPCEFGWDIYNEGDIRSFQGWRYECLEDDVWGEEKSPAARPDLWKRLDYVGAPPAEDVGTGLTKTTLTGMGPLDWFFDGTASGVADVVGNCYEFVYGVRLVNDEIQILADNNAATADADMSASAPTWRAILPNRTDDGYTMVAPGTAGTVHYGVVNNKLTLIGRALTSEELDNLISYSCPLAELAVDSDTLPYVPHILRELGLAPVPGTEVSGDISVQIGRFELICLRGTMYTNRGGGVAGLFFFYTRDFDYSTSTYIGTRPRALE